MSTVRNYLSLMRVYQWYKNLVIFIPIFFLGLLFDVNSLFLTVLGFLSLALVSSSNYVINDILDIRKDRIHPEKRNRPLASKKVSILEAYILSVILLVTSSYIAYLLSPYFLIAVASLFVLTSLYSLYLKNEPFLDILLIGIFFVIRAVSGTFIFNATISPWLVICTFFLSLFLTTSKRKADLESLGEKAVLHKPVLKFYNSKLTDSLLVIITTSLILAYTLYTFSERISNLSIITLPVALYLVFHYLRLTYGGSKVARNPHLVFKDVRFILGISLWVLLLGIVVYL